MYGKGVFFLPQRPLCKRRWSSHIQDLGKVISPRPQPLLCVILLLPGHHPAGSRDRGGICCPLPLVPSEVHYTMGDIWCFRCQALGHLHQESTLNHQRKAPQAPTMERGATTTRPPGIPAACHSHQWHPRAGEVGKEEKEEGHAYPTTTTSL